MDVTPIVLRLQERLAALPLREIGQAPGLDAAMRGNRAAPAVYVIPLSERGQELPHTGEVDQLETRVFGVLQVLEARYPDAAGSVLDLADLRQAIKAALVGWVPEAETGEPVLFLGGELVQLEGDGALWWSDEYLLNGYFRSTL